ncbi:Rieske (2Fe-2S) protein [Actinophytocola sp. S1-96]|uniref:Cytochrome bc1 complex Rieske iron-sulfur subunit n=1 Tax=Actinophytocola gossypii TaxID=2812003 RepID=A0ABT2J1C4_9PSEU|nr:Rieske (2Fe-2S) protein [Actinophytocola gossypii]
MVTGGAPPDTTAQTTEPPAETTEQTTTEPAPPPLASTSDIPVGGGTVFADQEIVITQPTRGDIRCFSAVCTHQGCLVSTVAGGTINCDCHGSKFAIADGSVTAGPAPEPLGEREILVEDGRISLP